MMGSTRVLSALILAAFCASQLPASAHAAPPAHAPAHGWRDKHQHDHYRHDDRYDRNYRNKNAYSRNHALPHQNTAYSGSMFGCNGDVLGGLVGGIAGAALGSQFGKGDGKIVAIISGAIVGVMAGGSIGRSVDITNNNCIAQTMEQIPDAQPVVWRGAQDRTYSITPTKTFDVAPGAYCREYTSTATVAGQQQQVYGTACRQPDGAWKIIG
ncbi:MAG: hypothetical protein CMM62_16865 [Rhodospirillaceae bacterium]|nr:hypothetical protein [Rhodospirillaceae bacterium]MAX61103.1 hypothetical protein [Rhodospirillaceae bacterium]MBB55845.1 hypothetical protein [Rhodospirillaceae bacterium]|tara:strand:- start:95600 stop:96235 length:636 start_codon:yes stop_codon:yes gene_type:complete